MDMKCKWLIGTKETLLGQKKDIGKQRNNLTNQRHEHHNKRFIGSRQMTKGKKPLKESFKIVYR